MKTRIGLIFGGRSGEHEISLRSARSVITQIDQERFTVIPIAIDREGRWLSPSESATLLGSEFSDLSPSDENSGAFGLLGDTGYNGMTAIGGDGRPSIGLDVIFPVLHGTFGEDGTIQGLLEMADIPYVGCGVLASACGMDKVTMKALFREAGLPICRFTWFLRKDFEASPEAVIKSIEKSVGYPCFVKPANLGSSVGVSRADSAEALKDAIVLASEYDRKIIVEEEVQMREIECAVIGNDSPKSSRPGEYVIRDKKKAFLDYTEKYTGTGNNEFVVPAPVSEELENKIKEMAEAAFKSIDGSGLARVDFFLRKDNGMLLVNEINTMPGLTDVSGFPKMWAGSGMSFGEVIDNLIGFAIERHSDRSRNKTSFSE